MCTTKGTRPLIGIGWAVTAAVVWTTTASGQDRCIGAGGGSGTEVGCSREGSYPSQDGNCTQGSGACYECEVQCPTGIVHCGEMDDGYPYQCCLPGEGGCWGWDNENPPDTDGDGDTQDPGNGSPILIDLDGNGFHLTGLNDAVLFDISGSGDPRHYSWTRAGSGDGFLCRDRDGSGGIETGRELFGDATLLSNGSRASNGFQALRELDSGAQGGNADGRLTIDDRMFQLLCVWVDEDHDGRSGASEIMSLWQAGVLELSVEYQESRRRDAHGNEFRYKSSTIVANRAGRPRRATTYDVFFVSRPAS